LIELKEKEKEKTRRIRALNTTIANYEEELAKPLELEDPDIIKAEGVSTLPLISVLI